MSCSQADRGTKRLTQDGTALAKQQAAGPVRQDFATGMQADLEQLLSKADAKRPLSRAAELDELATRHKLHITHLEQVQRLLHNDEVSWLGESGRSQG